MVIRTFRRLRRETRTHRDGSLQTSWLSELEVSAYCWSYLGCGALPYWKPRTWQNCRSLPQPLSECCQHTYFPAPLAKLRDFWSSHETCPSESALIIWVSFLRAQRGSLSSFSPKDLTSACPPTFLVLPDTLTRFSCPDPNKLILSKHSNYDVTSNKIFDRENKW